MYLDVTSLGMFLTYLMKGNGSAEVGEIVVEYRYFSSCRVVTTAAKPLLWSTIHLVPAPSETCWFRGMSVGGSFRRV